VVLAALIASVLIANRRNDPTGLQQGSASDGVSSAASQTPAKPSPAQRQIAQPIYVTAENLLSAFNADEDTARDKYKNQTIFVNGLTTQVFFPPPELALKMAEEGRTATPFLTMAAPTVYSAGEAIMVPGIFAYSDNNSIFGMQPNGEASAYRSALASGSRITLRCKLTSAIAVTGGHNVELEDCSLSKGAVPASRPIIVRNGYGRYENSRFGYSIAYPASFTAGTAPVNGDGLSFTSKNGDAILGVYGSNSVSGSSIASRMDEYVKGIRGNIAYRASGSTWFVVAWTDPDGVKAHYYKTFIGTRSENSFLFSYPYAEPDYEATVTAIERSFRPGDLNQAW
jgi:hypothetical protein